MFECAARVTKVTYPLRLGIQLDKQQSCRASQRIENALAKRFRASAYPQQRDEIHWTISKSHNRTIGTVLPDRTTVGRPDGGNAHLITDNLLILRSALRRRVNQGILVLWRAFITGQVALARISPGVPDEEEGEGCAVCAEKREGRVDLASGEDEDLCIRRLPSPLRWGPVLARSAYIVSSVYEARFKSFTLAFTLFTPLRLRSLGMPLAAFPRDSSMRQLLLR